LRRAPRRSRLRRRLSAAPSIDGQGSEFRTLTPGGSHRANWRFVGGRNLTGRNVAVRGSNPTGVYDHPIEWQHGFSVEGVQTMTLSNVQARETWGDGVFVWHGATSPACGGRPRRVRAMW
jgi:hypothetical protein